MIYASVLEQYLIPRDLNPVMTATFKIYLIIFLIATELFSSNFCTKALRHLNLETFKIDRSSFLKTLDRKLPPVEKLQVSIVKARKSLYENFLKTERHTLQSKKYIFFSKTYNDFILKGIVKKLKKESIDWVKLFKGEGYLEEMFAKSDVKLNSKEIKWLNNKFTSKKISITPKKIKEINEWVTDFDRDINALQKIFGKKYFTDSVIGKSSVNYMGMRFINHLSNANSVPPEVINAIALLHPLTDELLDSNPELAFNTVKKLFTMIKGEKVIAENEYEKLIFTIAQRVTKHYPIKENKLLYVLLDELNKVQLESAKIQNIKAKASLSDIFDISVHKGGITWQIFGYFSLGDLSTKELKYFYEGGGIYQLVDDLGDLPIDLLENMQTIWTYEYSKHKSLNDMTSRFFNMIARHNQEGRNLLSDTKNGQKIYEINQFGYMFLSNIFALKNTPISKMIGAEFEKYLPVSFRSLRKIWKEMATNIDGTEISNKTTILMFKEGLMNGSLLE